MPEVQPQYRRTRPPLPGRGGAGRRAGGRALVLALFLALLAALPVPGLARQEDPAAIAASLAEMLRAARSVVSNHQELINDPKRGDKGLTGDRVVAEAVAAYRKTTGVDPLALDPQSRHGRLIRAEMDSIRAVVDRHRDLIDQIGVGFKAFIPAVFARMVTEEFDARVDDAAIKVTAPPRLVRNRKARPDAWESEIIATRFSSPQWERGKPISANAKVEGRPAFRMLVPEYYTPSCLSCHGAPAGEVDITGYEKEGGAAGDLGAVISITLFD